MVQAKLRKMQNQRKVIFCYIIYCNRCYTNYKRLNIYIPKLTITSLFWFQSVKPEANKENNMEEATTLIINVDKKLSSGMNEDLAEGTNAPIGDDSSIPLKVSENIEDFKITTGKFIFTI